MKNSSSITFSSDTTPVELLQIFIMKAPVAIAMLDRSMRYITASKRWLEDFKIPLASVNGLSHYEIFPEIPPQWKEIHKRCLNGATEHNPGEKFKRHDETTQWLAWEIQPWQTNADSTTPDGIIIYCEDLTELYTSQEQEAQLRTKLAIDQALKAETEKTLRSKDTFIANLAHELRNPLNSTLGWIQIMHKESLDAEKVSTALEVIEQNAWLLSKLVSDTLDMNRIISGKMSLTPTNGKLNEQIDKAIKTFYPIAKEKHISLSVRKHEEDVAVSIDHTRFQQALGNLIANAVKFTPHKGSISIVTSVENSSVHILISDTGQGIDGELLPQIFERYVQRHVRDANHSAGLGLGLTIAKHIIEQHGGTLEAKSPGKDMGSTFTITLPLTSADISR